MTERRASSETERIARFFGRLREEDAATTPPFDAILARASRPRYGRVRLVAAAATVLLLAILGIVFSSRWHPSPEPDAAAAGASIADWRSPTDFLLRTPGSELIESTPAIPEALPDHGRLERASDEKGAS